MLYCCKLCLLISTFVDSSTVKWIIARGWFIRKDSHYTFSDRFEKAWYKFLVLRFSLVFLSVFLQASNAILSQVLCVLTLFTRQAWADDNNKCQKMFKKCQNSGNLVTIFRITMRNAFKWVQTCLVFIKKFVKFREFWETKWFCLDGETNGCRAKY